MDTAIDTAAATAVATSTAFAAPTTAVATGVVTTAPRSPGAGQFEFFDLRVLRTVRLGRSMVRVTFGGARLGKFVCGGRDQRFKLFLPRPGQSVPLVPTEAGANWFAKWQSMDPAKRAVMRTYTVREQRRDPDEIDVEFALHGDSGPATRWAARALPGDRLVALGPVLADNAGVDFRPPQGTDWVLIAADETALPATAAILASLPAGVQARVWIEVPCADDVRQLPTEAKAEITWLIRDSVDRASVDRDDDGVGAESVEGLDSEPDGAHPTCRADLTCAAVRAAELPADGRSYAWLAGESSRVRTLRRHLVSERGFDRRNVKFTGYWRLGATEEDLVAEAAVVRAAAQQA